MQILNEIARQSCNAGSSAAAYIAGVFQHTAAVAAAQSGRDVLLANKEGRAGNFVVRGDNQGQSDARRLDPRNYSVSRLSEITKRRKTPIFGQFLAPIKCDAL